jgi:hypothetical protein
MHTGNQVTDTYDMGFLYEAGAGRREWLGVTAITPKSRRFERGLSMDIQTLFRLDGRSRFGLGELRRIYQALCTAENP